MLNITLKSWLHAARLRTLPLASASIILGSALAYSEGTFAWPVLLLALLTALLLQILSNLANDYGDAVSGVDDDTRVGPARAIQAGLLTKQQMLRAIIVLALLAALSGIALLAVSLGSNLQAWLGFIALGGLSIVAAMAYTMGSRPYGYRGFGDISVFLFFGLLGVMGCYYLHTQSLSWPVMMIATANGLLATAVLNINNLRDFSPDKAAGKLTLAVRLGERNARRYHLALVALALLLFAGFIVWQSSDSFAWLCLLPALALIKVTKTVMLEHQHQLLDKQLQLTAKLSFFIALLFSLGLQFHF
jgi:1,4-dihydroxy-2-naphthoate octaprenyltransferase